MNPIATNVLVQVFENTDIFLLIIVRLLGFFIVLPVLAGQSIPTLTKISLSIAIGYIIFVSRDFSQVTYSNNIVGYFMLISKEFLVGFILSYVIYIIFSVFYYVGQLIDSQIGFSMVSVFDPLSQIQAPITGNLLYFVMCVFLIQSGGLEAFITGIFYSYDTIPIGSAKILSNNALINQVIFLITNYFTTGIIIALPIVGSILVLDVALGILVKAVPQMNIFAVGMPIKLLVGLCILYVVNPIFASVYKSIFDNAYSTMMNIIEGLGT